MSIALVNQHSVETDTAPFKLGNIMNLQNFRNLENGLLLAIRGLIAKKRFSTGHFQEKANLSVEETGKDLNFPIKTNARDWHPLFL